MRRFIGFIIVIALIGACAPSRFIEPVEEGKLAIGGTFGGPLIEFGGAPIPVPLSSIEAGYGFRENLTFTGGLHTTTMVFGNVQLDLGATYQFLKQEKYRPNISVSPSLNTVWDVYDKKIKAWPVLDLNAFWNYGQRKNYFYLGANNFFELSRTRALDQPQPTFILFSPQIGHVLKGKERKWELVTELKFLGPFTENTYSFVPYKSATGAFGSTGVFIGYRSYFNLKK